MGHRRPGRRTGAVVVRPRPRPSGGRCRCTGSMGLAATSCASSPMRSRRCGSGPSAGPEAGCRSRRWPPSRPGAASPNPLITPMSVVRPGADRADDGRGAVEHRGEAGDATPSTSSSITMSAAFSPLWGRAGLPLSILTTARPAGWGPRRAGRSGGGCRAPLAGRCRCDRGGHHLVTGSGCRARPGRWRRRHRLPPPMVVTGDPPPPVVVVGPRGGRGGRAGSDVVDWDVVVGRKSWPGS